MRLERTEPPEAGRFSGGPVSPRAGATLTKVMNEHEDLLSRLRAMGRRPVDSELAGRHLAAMAGAADGPVAVARPHGHRLKIVAAFTVGLLVGTTGLATAGALPNGAQEVAHHALGAVGVSVPHGDRYQGPECGGPVKNHGQYVRSQPKGSRAQAAASRCGKPLQAGQDGADDSGGRTAGPAAGCQGPPPWAGKGKPDQAAKDARKKACGDAADDNGDDQKGPAAPSAGTPGPAVETPTTAATTTTTTAPTQSPSTTATTATTTTTSTTAPGPGSHNDPTTTTATPGSGGSSTTVTSAASGLGS